MHIAAYVFVALLLVAAVVLLTFLYRRRRLVSSRSAIEMSVYRGRGLLGGWVMGIAIYRDTEIRWYRFASLWPRPSEVFSRFDSTLRTSREPREDEATWIPPDAVILDCIDSRGAREIAVSRYAATGLMSWWESAPPGLRSEQRDFT